MTNTIDDMFNAGQESEWKTNLIDHLNQDEKQFIRDIDIDTIGVNELELYVKLLASCCVRNHLVDDEHAVAYVVSTFYELNKHLHSILDSIYEYEEIDAIKRYTQLIHNIDELMAKRKGMKYIQEFKIKQRYKQEIREPGEEG